MNETKTDTRTQSPEVVVSETTALATRRVEPTLAILAERDDALAVTQREYEGLLARQTAAIALTDPTDWVAFQDREGGTTFEPRASAVKKAGGLFPFRIVPLGEAKEVAPYQIAVPTPDGEVKGWRIAGRAVSEKLNREVELEVTILEGQDWSGRKLDSEGKVTTKRDIPTLSHEGDQRSAARSALELKAFKWFSGLTRVPGEKLEMIWSRLNPPKSLGGVARGSGFGTASSRTATAVQDPGVKAKADELWTEILKRVQGDTAKAADLLYDITVNKTEGPNKGKYGIKEPSRFTRIEAFEYAWRRLRNHDVYGDDAMKGA